MRCGLWHNFGPSKTGERETLKVPKAPIEAGRKEKALGWSPASGPESGAERGLWVRSPCLGLWLCSYVGERPLPVPILKDSDLCFGPHATLHTHLVYRGLNQGSWEGFIESSWLPLSPLRSRWHPGLPTCNGSHLPSPTCTHPHTHTRASSLPTPAMALTPAGVWVFVFLVSGWFLNKQKI